MLNRLHITAGWSPDHVAADAASGCICRADYERYDWRASAAFNDADFYDLVGPTKVGRKGYSALVGHRNTLIFDEPRRLELDLSGRVSGNLDRLPDYQNVPGGRRHAGHAQGGARLQLRPQLARIRGRGDGPQVVARAEHRRRRRGASSRSCSERSIAASACASGTRRSGCGRQPDSRRAAGPRRSATSSSAGSATTTSTTATRSATGTSRVFPASS